MPHVACGHLAPPAPFCSNALVVRNHFAPSHQADMAKLEASDAVVFGISIDSPAANNAFAQKIGVTFPLLSDMNRKVLKEYGILKMYSVQKEEYDWAQRTTFVVDKKGMIQSVEEEASAINPNNAIAVCTKLPKK